MYKHASLHQSLLQMSYIWVHRLHKHHRRLLATEGCPRTDLGEKPGSVFPQRQLLQETLHSTQPFSTISPRKPFPGVNQSDAVSNKSSIISDDVYGLLHSLRSEY